MPSTRRGAAGSPGGGGSSTSSQLPAVSRSPLPRTRPSTTTEPASATSAATVRDRPNSRDSAWSTRWPSSPSGTGSARCRPAGVVTRSIVAVRGPRPPRPAGPARRGPGPSDRSAGLAAAAARPRRAAPAVELDAADGEQRPEDAAADDGRVGDVEHRPDPPVGGEDGDEVDDAAAEEAGIPEDPVEQVADG